MFGPSANVLLNGYLENSPQNHLSQAISLYYCCLFVLLLRPICFYKNCGLISEERLTAGKTINMKTTFPDENYIGCWSILSSYKSHENHHLHVAIFPRLVEASLWLQWIECRGDSKISSSMCWVMKYTAALKIQSWHILNIIGLRKH